ncbi:hypothetical protein PBT88_00895 [Sphingomonas abietis]|uniref:AAA+ ATPase domain-containing protein n=1 Tax=Sphingomonas abietis TaxID=3012344 RepID=A0ABY7NNF0_9SPHN|nr:hypothetical protein [Sphingomonas abietis]WBO22742.1 hypothetical protein PBT88_00895 [Sphingomonas abietis]
MRLTEATLDVALVHVPAKAPHLKPLIEHLFGTLNVRVFSLLEGYVKSKDPDYDPSKTARFCLSELNRKIVTWIVDEYHQHPHPGLPGKRLPQEEWLLRTQKWPVRPLRNFGEIISLTGEDLGQCVIGPYGVTVDKFHYVAEGNYLKELMRRFGKRTWQVRADPYNLGEVWLFNDVDGEWVSLLNADPNWFEVSRFAYRLIHKVALRRYNKKSEDLTLAELLAVKLDADREAAAIFDGTGPVRRLSLVARFATIFIDEATHVFRSRDFLDMAKVIDFWKQLINGLPCQLIFAGLPSLVAMRDVSPELRGRLNLAPLVPYRWGIDDEVESFFKVLDRFEELAGLSGKSNLSADLTAKRMYIASEGGKLGLVARLLSNAVCTAHDMALDKISLEVLGLEYDDLEFSERPDDELVDDLKDHSDDEYERIRLQTESDKRQDNPFLCDKDQIPVLWRRVVDRQRRERQTYQRVIDQVSKAAESNGKDSDRGVF